MNRRIANVGWIGVTMALGAGLLPLGRGACGDEPPRFDATAIDFFESKVRPLLVERCHSCHGPEKQKGGLRLDDRAAILEGGDTGPAAIAGEPDASLLIEAVRYEDALQMPPRSRLPESEVAILTRWVALGLPWPEAGGVAAAPRHGREAGFDIEARKAEHWAWRPIADPPAPAVADAAWPAGAIDRFLLARLERAGLAPAPEADRRALLRRLHADLTGLPPTIAEQDTFLDDPRPDAYERLVDRLLASPRFGERWARHWLDLVRYAETRGHEFDPVIPNAWRYRDYVVRALNADVPYDRFLTEHIAGDLIATPRIDPATGADESLLGTGFWFLGEEVHSPVDVRLDETDRMDNRLDVMTKTFLGLTVACARCHDHKFDPIPQSDYYALAGFLISSTYRQARYATLAAERDAARGLEAVRSDAGAEALREAGRAIRSGLDGLGSRLLAAAARLGTIPSAAQDPTEAALRRAIADRSDPLHPLAAMADAGAAPRGDAFRARLAATLGDAPADPAPIDGLVVDFGRLDDLDGWQNGAAFGTRPARVGEARLADGPDGPRLGVTDLAAATRDAGTPALAPLADDERDHGRLGTWERAGQTLRTPEFTLQSGRLWYLVRGTGRAYASINAHLVVAGPLHAAVLTEWKADPPTTPSWRWVSHDLSAYKGNRLHVEFCPAGEGELAVARVVDAATEPPLTGTASLAVAGAVRSSESLEDLAGRLETLFRASARAIEEGLPGLDPSAAALADWLLANRPLVAETAEAGGRAAAALARFREARAAILDAIPRASPTAPAILDGNGIDEHILIRGSSRTPGPPVPRRFLTALGGRSPSVATVGSGRLELAGWMLDPSNPFTARVMVNRVWQHLFGRGIVPTVDNFGALGEAPTHPELLDHLAAGFVRDGWSVKRLIRSIVLSRGYRMSSTPDPIADARDPGNRLWHRRELTRLEAEPLRDAILAVSGRLVERIGGPSVPVHLTPFLQGRGRPSRSGPLDGDGRRTLYLSTRRNFLSPFLLAFDAPIPFTTMGRRNASNVPAQALILLNDPFVIGEARRWGAAVSAAGLDPEEGVRRLYREAFARPPDDVELAGALAYLDGQEPGADAWADLAHVLLNAKEFRFLE